MGPPTLVFAFPLFDVLALIALLMLFICKSSTLSGFSNGHKPRRSAMAKAALVFSGLLLVVFSANLAIAAIVTVDFDSFPLNSTVTDNYRLQGVVFQRGVTFSGAADLQLPVVTVPGKVKGVPGHPLAAHSGKQVADISQCHNDTSLECEFFIPAAGATLTTTASRIQVWVGSMKGGTNVTLTVFNTQHHAIGSASIAVKPGVSMQPLAVNSKASNIAYFQVTADTMGTTVVVDDVTVATPDTPSVADFSIEAAGAARLRQGGTVTLPVTISRTNLSSGSVQLSATGLPNGVTATFTPRFSLPGALPEQSTLTLTAAPDAAINEDASVAVTIVGSPLRLDASIQGSVTLVDSGAGPAPRNTSIALNIVPSFRVQVEASTGIPPCIGISVPVAIIRAPGFLDAVDLRIDNLPPGVTGTFDSPSVGPPPGGGLENQVFLVLKVQPGRADNQMTATLTATSGTLPQIQEQIVLSTSFSTCGLTPSSQGSNRGCLLFSLTPEWVSVDPNEATRRVEGRVFETHTNESTGDDAASHISFDVNAHIELDPQFAFMNSESNEQHDMPGITGLDGRWIPSHKALTMEMEWEKGYFDSRYRPAVNDRAVLIGRWIYDCGHPPFQTEIHPPHFVVFIRPEAHTFAGVPGSTLANVARAYAFGRGSDLPATTHYYSVADQNLAEFAKDYQFEIPLPSRPSQNSQPIAEIVEVTFGGPTPILTIAPTADRVLVTYPLAAYLSANKNARVGAVIAAGWSTVP